MPIFSNSFKPKANTFRNTFCVFDEVDTNIILNQTPNFESASKSKYFYTEAGMYRFSNHWGKLANCKWRLVPNSNLYSGKFKLGYASWETFYQDNSADYNYYLEVNFDTQSVIYQHKNNTDYDINLPLFSYKEVSKRINQIKNLFENTNWAKHFQFSDIHSLRKLIITQLIETKLPLDQVKRNFFNK